MSTVPARETNSRAHTITVVLQFTDITLRQSVQTTAASTYLLLQQLLKVHHGMWRSTRDVSKLDY